MELFVKWISSLIGAVFTTALAGYWANITLRNENDDVRSVALPIILLVAALGGGRLGLGFARAAIKD